MLGTIGPALHQQVAQHPWGPVRLQGQAANLQHAKVFRTAFLEHAPNGDGLHLQQGALCGVAVHRCDGRGALQAHVDGVAAAAGQRQARVALAHLQHLQGREPRSVRLHVRLGRPPMAPCICCAMHWMLANALNI
jgi:hypothetical protein